MKHPVMEYPIEDGPIRKSDFSLERVHPRLGLVVEENEQNPWQADKEYQSVQNEERRESRFFIISPGPIEPKDLG